ncbi:metallopeptidase family protein [Promineifilum sp.]|uniref:metallopeptidase family protein n=1 Tax=Promineifilum sp. TaxID=2664178 RepID=UPI0035B168A6
MLSESQFEELVGEALDDLPPFFQAQMDNVVILVEPQPSRRLLRDMRVPPGDTLLGLYRGIPLTERGQGYNLAPPDTITLFQIPIERAAAEWAEGEYLDRVREEVRHTVIHEIAHHFGIDDDRLEELGAY